jgi:ABC-type transport system substrate-binding protein
VTRSGIRFSLATAVVTGCILTGACADRPSPPRDVKGGDGVLRLSLPGEPRSLNPNVAPLDELSLLIGQNIFSKLVSLADDGGILPEIAERWDESADGRTYTFYIRRGIRFHDGQPLTADDVRTTFARIAESSNSEVGRRVASVQAPDPATVVITLETPWAAFIPTLGWYGTSILPAHIYANRAWRGNPANMRPIGSGPFKFKSWDPGHRIVLEKNADYFGQGPYVDELEYVIAASPAAGVRLLLDGRTDYLVGRAPATMMPELSRAPGIRVSTSPSDGRAYLAFNMRRAPFNDLRARRAVNLAIDRLRIIDRVLSGLGTPAVGFYTPAVAWAYNDAARAPEHDAIKAKRLLAELARQTPASRIITFAFPGPPNASPTALGAEIVQQLQEVGFQVRITPMALHDYLERLQAEHDFDVVILTGNQGPDPESLTARFASDGSMQVMGYANADLDAVLAQGGRQKDPRARASAYFRAQEILAADLPIAPLYETVRVSVFRDGIRGLPHEDAEGLIPDHTFNLVRLPRFDSGQVSRPTPGQAPRQPAGQAPRSGAAPRQ